MTLMTQDYHISQNIKIIFAVKIINTTPTIFGSDGKLGDLVSYFIEDFAERRLLTIFFQYVKNQ
jgi:hypothetical protein